MSPRRRIRPGRLIIAIGLVAIALGTLVYMGTRRNLTYYYEVDEVRAAEASGHKIRVSGDVVEGSIQRQPDGRGVRFAIESARADGESGAAGRAAHQVPVVYSGTIPDIFRPGIQVVVEGRMVDGVFHAETLLAKCPSKYQEAGQLDVPRAPARS